MYVLSTLHDVELLVIQCLLHSQVSKYSTHWKYFKIVMVWGMVVWCSCGNILRRPLFSTLLQKKSAIIGIVGGYYTAV
jgi:hypothetical protein